MAHFLSNFLKQRSVAAAKTYFKLDAYNKYGLYHDDLIGGPTSTFNEAVAEAERRLLIDRPDLHDQKVYRCLRATQLKIQKKILPKDEWTTFEEDLEKGRYLQPYLEQIAREDQEKKEIAMLD